MWFAVLPGNPGWLLLQAQGSCAWVDADLMLRLLPTSLHSSQMLLFLGAEGRSWEV